MPASPTDTPGRFALFTQRAWWRAFWPAPIAVDAGERWRALCGAAVGILFTALACHLWSGPAVAALPWIIAPMGASAVLVFAVPASPLAQPWAVVGGNTLSALVGISLARWAGGGDMTAALAVACAIGMMFSLRCLHPPGGATALMMVLGGVQDPAFALYPVLANSVLLTLAGIAYNNATRRRYPHAQVMPPAKGAPDAARDDLDAVLARYNQVLDISRDDLQAFIDETQARGYQRRLAEIRCGDIMSRQLVTVEFGTPLQDAWALLRQRRIKALPVVDRMFRIVGIVTLADFMRSADLDRHPPGDAAARLRRLIHKSTTVHSEKPEVVGQIMTRQVRVSSEKRGLVELIPLFGSTGHHHIPIIGERSRLVGILTQSDVVSALCPPGVEGP